LAFAGLEAWESINGVPEGATSYALFGFRLQGLSALAGSSGGLPGRLADRLTLPLLGSGLGLVLLWSIVGVHGLRERPTVRLTVLAWGGAGLCGVLLGGSYWAHYLIELIPVAAVTAGLALEAGRRGLVSASASLVVAVAVAGALIGPSWSGAASPDFTARSVGRSIAGRSRRGDTIYVRYSQPNIAYYSGLRTPYPYDWSLMMRTIPGAQHRLRALLRSPQRPTWVVDWEPSDSYGLDASGATARLLHAKYRSAGGVDGVPILLERGALRPG
jgi:hypothetical protein